MTRVKICGIRDKKEIEFLNEIKPDFAGFVMFFEKSKRNIEPVRAKELLSCLDKNIKSVAVTVSPKMEQVKQVFECGFDLIQIHGEVSDEVLSNPYLKVLRAFNVTDIDNIAKYGNNPNIVGYVFDAAAPGSGKLFDWNILENISRDSKLLFLAGGLTPENVATAINTVNPDVVDVSSGVEGENGKSREKIVRFISNARDCNE